MGGNYLNNPPRKVGIPLFLESTLNRDMQQFEMLKDSDNSLAVNRFYNALIQGYYAQYRKSQSVRKENLQMLLSPYIKGEDNLERVIVQIMSDEKEDENEGRKTGGLARFRPTGDSIDIDDEIYHHNANLAGFYRDMFLSYSRKPFYERERIIYHETVAILETACREHKELSFYYRDSAEPVNVIPYKLVHGLDEQFNSLLCQDLSKKEKKAVASFRLRRIHHVKIKMNRCTVDPEIRYFLDKMMKYDPQYVINEDREFCFEMTKDGIKDFGMIYTGRPVADKIDPPDDHGNCKYYFRCSWDQVYQYFKRFNPGEAKVLYPEGMKRALRKFHEDHLESMKE